MYTRDNNKYNISKEEVNKMKKTFKFISIFISIIMIICIYPISINAVDMSNCTYGLEFYCDDNIDLSGIKVDIKAISILNEYTENLVEYTPSTYISTITDASGICVFNKPNTDFIIEIDLETLPEGYGVKQQIIYCKNNTEKIQIEIYEIFSVNPYFVYGELNFTFCNKNGDNILVDYTILDEKVNVDSYDVLNMDQKSIVSYNGIVKASGVEYTFSFDDEITINNKLLYLDFLKSKNIIDENEWLSQYSKLMVSEDRKDYITTEFFDTFQLYQTKLDKNSKLYNDVSNALRVNSVSNIEYLNYKEASYLDSSTYRRYVRVYYTTEEYASIATAYATEAAEILEYFCNQWNFNSPQPQVVANGITISDDRYYPIFLNPNVSSGAYTVAGAGSIRSYIEVGPNDYSSNINNAIYDVVLAHELQHAIQITYHLTGEHDIWLKESFANWAAAVYADYKDRIDLRYSEWEAGIQGYFSTTNISLTNYSYNDPTCINSTLRQYSLLFPTYIYQSLRGIDKIEAIYTQIYIYRNNETSFTSFSNDDIWNAIDYVARVNAGSVSNRSLKYILEEFGRCHYTGATAYNLLRGALVLNDEKVSNIQLSRGVTLNSTIQSTGYGYFKLSSSPDEVNINISISSNDPTAITYYIIEGFSTSNIAASTKIQATSANLNLNYTFKSSMGKDLAIIIANTSTQYHANIQITVN